MAKSKTLKKKSVELSLEKPNTDPVELYPPTIEDYLDMGVIKEFRINGEYQILVPVVSPKGYDVKTRSIYCGDIHPIEVKVLYKKVSNDT